MLRKLGLTFVLIIAHSAYANGPGRAETLDRDLQGPRVSLVGEIIARVDDGADTCFILDRAGYREGRFIACNSGYFEPAVFGPGAALKAVGNLGAAVPREIGGQIYDYPVVAGALISKASSRDYYDGPSYDPYYYGPYPYGGYGWHPWHYPFYGPHFGTGIFFHID
ncbi:MAG: Slp family lipoprotein [Burkholderiales bacterium]